MTPAPSCDYCGLPVPAREGAGPVYCCFGCRFAAGVTQARGEQGAAGWMLARLGLAVFLSMNVMVFTMALWTQDFYGAPAEGALEQVLRGLFRYLCLLFALPVLFLLGGPLAENAWQSWRQGTPTTDGLLVLGVLASYGYSAISVFCDAGPVYFEVGCAVLVLVTLGRWLEAAGKLRTTAALESLQRLLPRSACVLRGGVETNVPPEEVAVGECVRVRAGERFPCDGLIASHRALVDEQVLTGESEPVPRGPGDPVHAGTLNLDGDLFVTVTAAAAGGALARLIDLVRRAREAKGRYERLADRVASAFVPVVLLLAVGTAAWHGARGGIDQGILAGLAVVLIACPCALGLATPMALWAALGQAARAGVLFRSGEALERLAAVRGVYFDKTGTLTTGTPAVVELAAEEGERPAVLTLAGLLASASSHCIALAVRRFVASGGSCAPQTGEVRTLAGLGLAAVVPDRPGGVYLGNGRLMAEAGMAWGPGLAEVRDRALAEGRSLTCLGWDGRVRAVFVLSEELRPEARMAIADLQRCGCDVGVLTGDHAGRGAALARALGVPVRAGLLPADKVAAVAEAQKALGPVALVGDGVNDAPALAAADAGLALGCGADVSRDAASVCLLGDDLARVPWALALARKTLRVIRQNLFWAFAYNLAGIGLACTGRLNPTLAALAMALSSFLVVANSLRLVGPLPGPAEGPSVPGPLSAAPVEGG